MTLACVFCEDIFGLPRITALADARATSKQIDGSFKVISDTTQKLFAVVVRCHQLESLIDTQGAFTAPYNETTIGVAFSGSCFEGLTLITAIQHELGQVATHDPSNPLPTGHGICNWIANLLANYFQSHSGHGEPEVALLIFGFEDNRPWVFTISYSAKAGVVKQFKWMSSTTFEAIGQSSDFVKKSQAIKRRIDKHMTKVKERPENSISTEDRELELEKLRHAHRKVTEEIFLGEMDNAKPGEIGSSVGGILQRLELYQSGGKTLAAFTRDDRPFLNPSSPSLSSIATLGIVPIQERMGR